MWTDSYEDGPGAVPLDPASRVRALPMAKTAAVQTTHFLLRLCGTAYDCASAGALPGMRPALGRWWPTAG